MKNAFVMCGLLFLFVNCGIPSGEFGWAVTNDEDISPIEEEFYVQTQFEMARQNLYFSPNDTIHYVYIFSREVDPKKEFFVSLNKKSIDYLEIDLRRKRVEENMLRDKYKNLEIGEYLLKIAFEGDVFDSVHFKVLPEEGYYTSENGIYSEEDEIIRYSKNF